MTTDADGPGSHASSALSPLSSDASLRRRELVEKLLAALGPGSPGTAANPPTHIGFRLGDRRYAAPLRNVVEIERPLRVVPAPNTPDFVLGVTNVRGEVLCLLDTHRLLQCPPAVANGPTRLLRVRGGARDLEAAIVVDAVFGVSSDTPLASSESGDKGALSVVDIDGILDAVASIEAGENETT